MVILKSAVLVSCNIGKNINLARCEISYIFTAFMLTQKKLMALT